MDDYCTQKGQIVYSLGLSECNRVKKILSNLYNILQSKEKKNRKKKHFSVVVIMYR